ncbi:MAG: hypothetical protein H7256_01605 [Bdellovibrio sp.]|nr:hypothetical protein [Bdellovibrio sp.]
MRALILATTTAVLFFSFMAPAEKKKTPTLQRRTATLSCEDRRIDIEGRCFQADLDMPKLSCSKLLVRLFDTKTKKVLIERPIRPNSKLGSAQVIEGDIGDVMCVESPSKEKYIIVMMGTGGNCEECEWLEAYAWDGSYIGTSRSKNKDIKKAVDLAAAAGFNPQTKKIIAQTNLAPFYTPDEQQKAKK